MHKRTPRKRTVRPGQIPTIHRSTDPIATAEQAHRELDRLERQRSMDAHPAGKARRPEATADRPMTKPEIIILTTAANAALAFAVFTAHAWITTGQPPL